MPVRTRRLFISHSWAYGDAYDKLVKMLNEAPRFEFANYSVPKNDPVHNAPSDAALYQKIKEKVTFCDVVIVLAGVYSTYSKWINKELRIAKQEFSRPKPVLAIQPWGSQKTSTVVRDAADKSVAWNTSSIVSAIRDLAP